MLKSIGAIREFGRFLDEHPATKRYEQLPQGKLGRWRVTKRADGVTVLHDCDYPVRVWAVRIADNRLLWAEAEVTRITKTRVTILYGDTLAAISRTRLPSGRACWRGVWFTSDRDGFVVRDYDKTTGRWQGRVFPAAPDAMPLDQARRLLGVPVDFTRDDIGASKGAASNAWRDNA